MTTVCDRSAGGRRTQWFFTRFLRGGDAGYSRLAGGTNASLSSRVVRPGTISKQPPRAGDGYTLSRARQRPLQAGQLAANIADVDTFPKLRAARRPTTGTHGLPGMAADINRTPSVDPVAARPHPRRPTGSAPATRPRDYVEVLVHVRLAPDTLPEVFDSFLRTEPGVIQAWRLAGDIDFEVHLRCAGLSDLHALLGRARKVGGAWETTTHLVLSAADDRRSRPKTITEK